MSHPLEKKVALVRRRARRLLWVYGLGWISASVVGVALVLGFTDYLIRFQDQGIRVIFSLLTLATLGWTSYRYLFRPLSRRLRDVDVAQRIERCFPQLGERLSSAIEFLKQPENDRQAGSASLRRAVIAKAAAQLEEVNLSEVTDRRTTARVVLSAAAVGLVTVTLVVLDVQSARIALARLTNPFAPAAWPRVNDLAFKNPPTRLALGQPFEVELVDRQGKLPDDVKIHYRYEADGEASEKIEPMKFRGGAMIARKDVVDRPFEYRAVGGDDATMAWTRLEVVEPPRIESLEITLHPPVYSGLPTTPSDKRIRALVGTRIAVHGATTKPLRAARLVLESGEEQQRFEGRVAAEGYEFDIPADSVAVEKSGAYWFELVDEEGLQGGGEARWELRAVTDTPPTVTIEQPAANGFVTPDAILPLRVLVKDNLAVHDVTMIYSRSDESEKGELIEVKLYERERPVALATDHHLAVDTHQGESLVVEYAWDLSQLRLAQGVQLTVLARASDYLPQIGESLTPRRITIISAVELEDRLSQREAFILAELSRALSMQRDVHGQTAALEVQLDEVGRLDQQDLDRMQAAELNQRQVARTLTSPTEGVPSHIATLLDDLDSNRVDSPDIRRRMQDLLDTMQGLENGPLPVIRRELTSALKTAQSQPRGEDGIFSKTDPKVAVSIVEAGLNQAEVIATLERLLGELSQWADYRRFSREVRQLREDQGEVAEITKEIGRETLTKDFEDLNNQQRAELKKAAHRQMDLARRLEKILEGMDRMGGELAEKDPLASATLDDALHQARQSAVAGQMRQAAGQLEQNRVGGAAQDQADSQKKLDELIDILANRREHELNRLVKKLREAEDELQRLRQEQRGLRKKIEDAAKNPNEEERKRELERLRREQKRLQEDLERMARKLKRLQADRAGSNVASAAGKLGESCVACEGGSGGEAGEKAKQAEKDLDEAQESLAEARRQAEADLLEEQLARFEDAVKGMIGRQQRVLEETVRLDGLQDEQGQLRQEHFETLRSVIRQEEMLEGEIRGFAEKMTQAEVFQLALRGAADDAAHAVERLKAQQTGESTQRHQLNALTRLEQLLQAMTDKDGEQKGGDEQKGGQGGSGGQGGQKVRDIAELKLLKLMQQDINRRTRALADVHDNVQDKGQPQTEEQQAEFDRLAREQGQLADLVLNLMQADETGDDLEQLPALSEEGGSQDELPDFDLEQP